MRRVWLVLAVAVAGCAPTHPLTDMTNVDPVAYQRDYDQCEAVAGPSGAAGPAVAGLLIGGTMGLGIGAIFSGTTMEAAAGYGAASGAAAGAGIATAASETDVGANISPGPPQSLDACLAAHGYKIIGHI